MNSLNSKIISILLIIFLIGSFYNCNNNKNDDDKNKSELTSSEKQIPKKDNEYDPSVNINIKNDDTNIETPKKNDNEINDPAIKIKATKEITIGDYVMTDIKGNYITSLDRYVAGLDFKTKYNNGQVTPIDENKMSEESKNVFNKLFNQNKFTRNDINNDYMYTYVGKGGPSIAKTIINDINKQFPDNTGLVKEEDLIEDEIILSYLLVKLEYPTEFDKRNGKFKNTKVKGFGLNLSGGEKEDKQLKNINLLYYKNENEFIIELISKNNKEQIIIAKGFNNKTPDDVLKSIKLKTGIDKNIEDFWMPKINIDITTHYENIQKHIPQLFKILTKTKFEINEKGTRVESVTLMSKESASFSRNSVKLYFSEAFMILLKNKKTENPYFCCYINNLNILYKI